MSSQGRNITLADVARAAGLSLGGTSYALRAHPSIPTKTVERVRRLAADLGYQPDLRIASLMRSVRKGKITARKEPLAFIWVRTPRDKSRLVPYVAHFHEAVISGAKKRAEELNCSLEEFWLDDGPMKPQRLNRILQTRGIAGFVLSTAASIEPVTLDWDWAPFASAIIGHTAFNPPLHRSAHHHYLGMCSTLRRLKDEGSCRPAAILGTSIQRRIHNMQQGAFLSNHPSPALASNLYRICEPQDLFALEPWPSGMEPDALIVQWQLSAENVSKLRKLTPSLKRIVTLDWYPHGVLPGIDPTYSLLAEKALDLVVAQLHANERGIPERPRITLFEGLWRESCPPVPLPSAPIYSSR